MSKIEELRVTLKYLEARKDKQLDESSYMWDALNLLILEIKFKIKKLAEEKLKAENGEYYGIKNN